LLLFRDEQTLQDETGLEMFLGVRGQIVRLIYFECVCGDFPNSIIAHQLPSKTSGRASHNSGVV